MDIPFFGPWGLAIAAIIGISLATRFTNLRHRALFDAFATCVFFGPLTLKYWQEYTQNGSPWPLVAVLGFVVFVARSVYAATNPEKYFTFDETGRAISRPYDWRTWLVFVPMMLAITFS